MVARGSVSLRAHSLTRAGLKLTAGRVRTDGHLPEASAVMAGWNSVGPPAG